MDRRTFLANSAAFLGIGALGPAELIANEKREGLIGLLKGLFKSEYKYHEVAISGDTRSKSRELRDELLRGTSVEAPYIEFFMRTARLAHVREFPLYRLMTHRDCQDLENGRSSDFKMRIARYRLAKLRGEEELLNAEDRACGSFFEKFKADRLVIDTPDTFRFCLNKPVVIPVRLSIMVLTKATEAGDKTPLFLKAWSGVYRNAKRVILNEEAGG